MRKTKIVCTIGPACSDRETLTKMCRAGMNVARLNFSHGTHETHKAEIELLKAVRKELKQPLAIMLDTKGPEYRIGLFERGRETIAEGQHFTFTVEDIKGDAERVSVSYKDLPKEMAKGDRILVNNGLVIFEVKAIEGTEIHCTVITGGVLSDRKSMSFPGKVMRQKYLSEQDKSDLLFGIENGVEFVAASFVSCKQDLMDLKGFLHEHGGDNIDVIAKIENRHGVDNIDEICSCCEGVMVARGDLGVEVPFTELPAIQKHLITKCRLLGKRVITATEMLESMINNPRPTRAEISDVANAVYDGTSAIMLSGESAAGKYPVESVRTMGEIAEETERHIDYKQQFQSQSFTIHNRVDAISHAACTMAIDLNASAIVVTSLSGLTVRMVSRFRAPITILGLATNKNAWYKLALSWGVVPVLTEQFPSMEVLYFYAARCAKNTLSLAPGSTVVMTGGDTTGASGNTNVLRIETIV